MQLEEQFPSFSHVTDLLPLWMIEHFYLDMRALLNVYSVYEYP